MSDMNVWDRVPTLVVYATFVDVNSDKFYEVRVDEQDDGRWRVTKRWGRNPDTKGGQTKVEECALRERAVSLAHAALTSKVNGGYVERPWPHGAEAMPDFHDLEATERWLARQ